MTRQLRIDYDGAWHHVMTRSTPGRFLFENAIDRACYFDRLDHVSVRFGLEVHAYCLMTNHLHLLVRSVSGLLSDGMHSLNSSFAQGWNRRRGTRGPLVDDRFGAKLVIENPYLLELFRYVHRNPFDAGMVTSVNELAFYPDSSLGAYLGLVPVPRFLHTDEYLDIFNTGSDATDLMHDFVKRTPPHATITDFYAAIDDSTVVGPDGDRRAAAKSAPTDAELSAAIVRTTPSPSLAEIEGAVATTLGTNRSEVFWSARGRRNDARTITVAVAFRTTARTHAELAAIYGFGSVSGPATAVDRFGKLARTDAAFAAAANEVLRRVGHGGL